MKIKLGITLVLAFLTFIFISQNTETVSVNYLAWSAEMSLVLLVFIVLGTGITIGWLLSSYLRFVRKRKQAKAQTKMQTDEVATQVDADLAIHGDKDADE